MAQTGEEAHLFAFRVVAHEVMRKHSPFPVWIPRVETTLHQFFERAEPGGDHFGPGDLYQPDIFHLAIPAVCVFLLEFMKGERNAM